MTDQKQSVFEDPRLSKVPAALRKSLFTEEKPGEYRCGLCNRPRLKNIVDHLVDGPHSSHVESLAVVDPDEVVTGVDQKQATERQKQQAAVIAAIVVDMQEVLGERYIHPDFGIPEMGPLDEGEPGSFWLNHANEAWTDALVELLGESSNPWYRVAALQLLIVVTNLDLVIARFTGESGGDDGKQERPAALEGVQAGADDSGRFRSGKNDTGKSARDGESKAASGS